MRLQTRLWFSHVIAFMVPIVLGCVMLFTALLGFIIYISNGNYVYVGHLSQYTMAQQALSYLAFRDIKQYGTLHDMPLASRVLDPEKSYIAVLKDDVVIQTYGDAHLLQAIDESIRTNRNMMRTFSDGHIFYTTITSETDDGVYTFLMATKQYDYTYADTVSTYIFIVSLIILAMMALAMGLSNMFLTRFTMQHILRPLRRLTVAAREVEAGNFEVHVEHDANDEFKPITHRFNAMVERLFINAKERENEETSRRELIAGISHDLRTPLTSIKAYVEGLMDGIAPTKEMQHKYLSTIQSKTMEIDHMLEQLFLFSKLDLGSASISTEVIALDEVLHDYVKDNYELYANKGLSLSLHIHQKVKVYGDLSILMRILENILVNSVKYKVKDRGHSRISLSAISTKAILTITDDGPGVPYDKISRIFDVFYRTDKARANTNEGSGLGLAIAYKYLKLMGGSIKACNVRPHGLQIIITIPLIQ